MAYSKDYREGVLRLLKSGMTLEEVRQKLGVSISAMEEWKRKERDGEGLGNRELERTARIFHEEELKKLVESNTDITLKKIAKHFGGSVSGASDACRRCKITLKKRKQDITSEMRQHGQYSTKK